ncbi:DNA cytosine methyltransferase [Polycladidibacter hongkongensis]|uniref:DNA cytosine methyltransferase n=1 Tax=Polycladidibacter hongkongensis TaxID=1647556 RepID=UPI00082CA862|nr:DNA cytosine methyltransferase [Pseudovibrio hongkongensis]
MSAYYNEIDKQAAQWLRELIAWGLIADGEVDERSISDVTPTDLRGFTQCHFFAGIGVWSYALRQAGWLDEAPVWTGSCPCQPFSTAGRKRGVADERHLWPHWQHLIRQCRPAVVFGEQVASQDGLGWFDTVQADMEGEGYAIGVADLCAAGVGAPHIRQRLYFAAQRLADPSTERCFRGGAAGKSTTHQEVQQPKRLCPTGRVADSFRAGPQRWVLGRQNEERKTVNGYAGRRRTTGRVADSNASGRDEGLQQAPGGQAKRSGCGRLNNHADTYDQHWQDVDWLFCRDGKWRPVEAGTHPLAHRAPARMGRLRGYGNAIVAQTARIFIEAFRESRGLDA